MSKHQEALSARDRPGVEERGANEHPTIVLDVVALEKAPLPAPPAPISPERRALPDELRGMYYHG